MTSAGARSAEPNLIPNQKTEAVLLLASFRSCVIVIHGAAAAFNSILPADFLLLRFALGVVKLR